MTLGSRFKFNLLHLRGGEASILWYFSVVKIDSSISESPEEYTYATSLLRSCTVSYLIHFFSIIREQNKRKMEQEEGEGEEEEKDEETKAK